MRYLSLRQQLLALSLVLSLIGCAAAQSQTSSPDQRAVSYGFVIDNSGSLRTLLNQILVASKTIVGNNHQTDETFLVRFTDRKNTKRVQDLTHDKEALADAIDNIFPEGGQTAILDALYTSADYLAQNSSHNNSTQRRALILITDGEDRESRHSLADVLQFCREHKIQVYAIGIMAQLEKDRGKKASQKAADFLTNVASETGGKSFFPSNPDELGAIANDLLNVIRAR